MRIVLKAIKAFCKASVLKIWRKAFVFLRRVLPLNEAQWAKLDLLKILVQRDLEARYKGSILGNLWPLLNQLAQLLIYTYVFAIVLRVKLELKGLPTDNSFVFGLWLFAGLLPWISFSTSLMQSSTSVVQQPNLVKKVVFPLTLLPLVSVFSALIESTLGLATLIVFVFFVTGQLYFTLLLFPLIWLTQLLLSAGLGLLSAGITVFIRDVPQTLSVLLNLWFYATPLIYPANLIPQPFQKWIFWLNPLATIGEVYRDVILRGEVTHWGEWCFTIIISAIIFFVGFSCYQKLCPSFADVL